MGLYQELEFENAIVVGLNFGAAVAIELANVKPQFVSHLVLIDPPILMEPWVEHLIKDHVLELKDPQSLNFSEELVELVLPHGSIENKEMAINAYNVNSKAALISTYENLLNWDKTSSVKLKKCSIPVLNVQSKSPFCSEKL